MFLLYILFIFLNIRLTYSSIEIIKIQENLNITITCHFNETKSKIISNKYSDNIIIWYKDDIQVIGVNSISNDKKRFFFNQINIYTYQLIIINIQLELSGLYKCQNFQTKEEKFFQLNVIVPPSHLDLISLPKMPVDDGTLVNFNCTSKRVYPNPIFEWYKNNKLIQRSIGNQTDSILFSSSSILTLLLTPADHNHILRCQVSNEASIHQTNIEIKLNVLFKPIIKLFAKEKELIQTLTIIENTSEIIYCKTLSNPSIISNIEWFKNDQLILGENQEQLRINFTDIKKLSCRAQNIIGQTESNIYINILYKPKLSLNKNLTLNQDEKLILKCLINSNPLCHEIRWLFNEKELIIQSCINENLTEYIIENINRLHAGKYTCEVKNLLNTTFNNSYDGISRVSTDVRVQYAPFILNSYKKLAIFENSDIITECLVDAYPKADIIWFGPYGQRLSSFTEEKTFNNTVISSKLHLPPSYSSTFGLYRCIAKNNLGQYEYSIDFQRPSLPDPPDKLQAINITYNSFILNWQSGYNGGSEQIFHIILISNHIEERYTNLTSIKFNDINEQTQYIIKIRSQNHIGFSNYSNNLTIITKEYPYRLEEFPIIQEAYFIMNKQRVRFRLNTIESTLITIDQLCIEYYNNDKTSSCIPLNTIQLFNNEFELNIQQINIRLKLCLINQTDICSKSFLMPIDNQLSSETLDLIFILIGSILGLCIVIGIIVLFICIHKKKSKKKSKNGSTDTLKINSDHHCHSILPVHVSDTNSCLYYPGNKTQALYFNDETTGIYSIHGEKNLISLDSGMLSTNSNNSDSIVSRNISSSTSTSDFYDRSDGEYLVNGKISTYTIGKGNHINNPIHGRIYSEKENGFSTSIKSHNEKKLVYEVVV